MHNKDKVYLIDLGTGTDRSLLPLGCGLIASYALSIPGIDSNYDIEILMLNNGIPELLNDIISPSIVGFACYCWNFFGCVELSKIIKDKYPDVVILWGGPSVPSRQHRINEFLERYKCVDVLVHGEGEITFADFLVRRLNDESIEECKGITVRNGGNVQTTSNRDRIKDFSIIPSPFLNGTFDYVFDRYKKQIVGALWETSRGCPFKCFDKHTKIITSRCPNKMAKNIAVGDYLLCIDEKTNEISETEVKQIFTHRVDKILRITFEDGTYVKTTEEHPFYVRGNWIEAKDLQVNDEIFEISPNDKMSFHKKTCNPVFEKVVRDKISKTVSHLYENGFKSRFFEHGFQKKYRCKDPIKLFDLSQRSSNRMKKNNPMRRADIKEKQRKTILKHIADGSVIPYMCTDEYWKKLKNCPNKSEIKMLKILESEFPDVYQFTGDGSRRIEYYAPDFMDENNKKIIEFNGCYWHHCNQCFPKTKSLKRDRHRVSTFEKFGYKILVVWAHELKNIDNLLKKLRYFTHNGKKIVDIKKTRGKKRNSYEVYNFSCYPHENYFANYVLSHNCSFCDWGSALVNKVNRFEVDRVLREIQWVSDKKIHYVYATDANFGITVQRDLEIADGFVKIAKQNGYPDTLILNWTKNSHKNIVKIAETLFAGGISTNVTLSYQSFHQPTLDAIERDNIKLEYLEELKKEFHVKGIPTYGELILGLPEETLESYIFGINSSLSPNLKDQLSIYLCCVLVNTQMYEDKEKYQMETRECAVGLNRRRFKFNRFGVDEIVVGNRTMSVEDWKRAYEISFVSCSLYNFRVAFFIMVYLHHTFGTLLTDFISYIIDCDKTEFPTFGKAIEHIRLNRQLILDNIASVSEIDGSEGVAFTPHEAITFYLLNHFDATYSELKEITSSYCSKQRYDLDCAILDDLFQYQKFIMPVFTPNTDPVVFSSNIPDILDSITKGMESPDLKIVENSVLFKHPSHCYTEEVEFNRRRVSCGYSIAMADAVSVRNINLAGKF